MKQNLFVLMSLLLMTLSTGCSKDDESSSSLLGTWEMEKSYIGYDAMNERIYSSIGEDEVTAVFQENGHVSVKRDLEQPSDDSFLPSGDYTYSFTTEFLTFYADNELCSKWNYIVENNSLTISFWRENRENAYPGPAIVYIFRRK